MVIKSITLNNYRLYKGENTLSLFSDEKKNITLISGENGFGKTTFLHSLIWCLYGKFMTDVEVEIRKDVGSKSYGAFLRGNMNNDILLEAKKVIDDNIIQIIKKRGYTPEHAHLRALTTYSVTIDFSEVVIPAFPCTDIRISRSYDIIQDKESVEILIDGVQNELTNEIGPEVFINDFILNKDVARFFFFDSEQIVALAETKSSRDRRRLCSAYNEVLGVKKYEELKKNLENLRIRFRRKSSDLEGRIKLEELLAYQNELERLIIANKESKLSLETEISNLQELDAEYQMRLIREGHSTSFSEVARLEALVVALKEKDTTYKHSLKPFMDYAPIAIMGKRLEEAKAQLENDYKLCQKNNVQYSHNCIVSDITSEILLMLERLPLENSLLHKLHGDIQDLQKKYQEELPSKEILLSISDNDYEEFMAIYGNITATYKAEFQRLVDDYRKNKQILDRNTRKLATIKSKENDELIKQLRIEKNELEQNLEQKNQEIRQLYEDYGILNQKLATVSKQVRELSKRVSLDDDNAKKDQLAGVLIEELSTFLVSLKHSKKNSLEQRIKSVLNSLMHKESFIGRVEVVIDGDEMDIELYTPDDVRINKESLSKGEQQLYATSLLKALVDESGIQFPVFIDAPLQKFDKSHASKIITEFYPQISKQVVLLPLLYKELTLDEFQIMKPLIKATYLLENDTTHSYFNPIPVDDFIRE